MFFQETAEEFVNRVFDDHQKSKIFSPADALLNHRDSFIKEVKGYDKVLNGSGLDIHECKLLRELFLANLLAKNFASLLHRSLTSPPPKPTLRQCGENRNHLRLVSNG